MLKIIKRLVKGPVFLIADMVSLPLLVLCAFAFRFKKKKINIGLGPEPLINNVYHKKALQLHGYSVETFVNEVYFITNDFDVRGDLLIKNRWLRHVYLFLISIYRYEAIYIYFNGGPLSFERGGLFWRCEPWLYRLAKVKIVIMPYGGDVQDLLHCTSLLYKHAMSLDYPLFHLRRKRVGQRIALWTEHADHILSGCEWVDYTYHWDTLMLAHFSIDVKKFQKYWGLSRDAKATKPLKILHAPNHRNIKGSQFFIRAVEELQKEGVPVELVLLERKSNEEVLQTMSEVDMIADQLIIGWYAMFAIEGMAMCKPVLCHLRADLINLYTVAGLIAPGEIPLINCDPLNVKEVIRGYAYNREALREIGERGLEYVKKHHSIESIGKRFDAINRQLGVVPTASSSPVTHRSAV